MNVDRWTAKLFTVPPPSGRWHLPSPWLLGFALAIVGFMFWMPKTGVDMIVTYGPAGRGELWIDGVNPRNPRFALWLFWLFERLPWKYDYLLIMLVSIVVLIAAVYWGGGKYWKAILSFPFIWLIAYGQIDAFIAAGLALSWWALQHKRFYLMGVGLAFACMLKPQVGIFAALLMWLWAENKWKPLVIPLILVLISLVQWGIDWPIKWINGTLGQVTHLEADWANASLYQWLQWPTLLIWIPVILAPMNRQARLRSVLAAGMLTLPYSPAYELLMLLVFPISIAEWALTNLPLLGLWGYAASAVVPLLTIIISIWPWLTRQAAAFPVRRSAQP